MIQIAQNKRDGSSKRPPQHRTRTDTAGNGERIAAEGEICWGGMHSWKYMIETLELVGKPETLGFQADLAHSMLFVNNFFYCANEEQKERFLAPTLTGEWVAGMGMTEPGHGTDESGRSSHTNPPSRRRAILPVSLRPLGQRQ